LVCLVVIQLILRYEVYTVMNIDHFGITEN